MKVIVITPPQDLSRSTDAAQTQARHEHEAPYIELTENRSGSLDVTLFDLAGNFLPNTGGYAAGAWLRYSVTEAPDRDTIEAVGNARAQAEAGARTRRARATDRAQPGDVVAGRRA